MLTPFKVVKNEFNTFTSITEFYKLSQEEEVKEKAKKVNGGVFRFATDTVSVFNSWKEDNCEIRLSYKIEK